MALRSTMTIGTRIYTWLNGKLVGTDRFGNRYYVNKGGDGARGGRKNCMARNRPAATSPQLRTTVGKPDNTW